MNDNGLVGHIGRTLLAEDHPPLSPATTVGLAVAVVAVVAIAGVMSGLTLGLLSMDRLDLELMMRTGSKKQERLARRLTPIVSQPNWVLAALVICNTAAGMALPLCLDRLVNVAVALVLSTTAIVLFGEILPQAVCSRYGLSIGGYTAPMVRGLMWLTAPISWPIAQCLDWMLGKEQPVFGKRQISALVDLHRESAGMGGPLNEEEAHVIQGVLDLSSKTGNKAMTPLDKVFMLSTDDVLDRPTLKRILDSGHSRVPVYRGDRKNPNIIGLILVKELLAVVGLSEPGSGPVHVKDLRIRDLPTLPVETLMTDLLNLFQTGHSHMALLLQKQDDTQGAADKDPSAPATITAVASSSSSSEGGSTPVAPGGSRSSSASPGASSKPNRVASFVKSLSGKALGRSFGKQKLRGDAISPEPQQHSTVEIRPDSVISSSTGPVGDAPVDAAVIDLLEAGRAPSTAPDSPHSQLPDLPAYPPPQSPTRPHASSVGGTSGTGVGPAASLPHSASAPGLSGRPGTPLGAPAGAAAVAAAGAAGGLLRTSPGLGRPSAAAVWQEAGWDAAAGVPVGIITLEDVLEELMQEEIVDETDAFIDNEKTCRVNARVLAGTLPPGLRRLLLTSQQRQLQQQLQPQPGSNQAQGQVTGLGSSPALAGPAVGPSAVIVSTGGGGQVTVVSTGTNLGQVAVVRTAQTGQARASLSISGGGVSQGGGSSGGGAVGAGR